MLGCIAVVVLIKQCVSRDFRAVFYVVLSVLMLEIEVSGNTGLIYVDFIALMIQCFTQGHGTSTCDTSS